MKTISSVLAGLCLTAALICAWPSTAAAVACTTHRIQVSMAPGQPASQQVAAKLCKPSGGTAEVDLLVHGATYNSVYWDWPQNPGLYSYVQRTVAAGRATLNFDRLGSGASSRPLSTSLSIEADIYVTHQLVQWLRARDFDHVTMIGHSLGAIVTMAETAQYGDVDRLVIVGMLHLPGLGPGSVGLFGSFYPAMLDSQFIGLLDPGWLTTLPTTRGTSFYYPETADPQVIDYDDFHKDIASDVEVAGALVRLALLPPLNDTNRIRVPVLVIMGERDHLLCDLLVSCAHSSTVLANEAPYYSSAASLTARTVPATGHSLTLHPSAPQSFNMINDWINTH